MDPTPHPAAPSDFPAPATEGRSVELGAGAERVAGPAAPAKLPLDPGSVLLPNLTVPRHRRPGDADEANGGALANARFIRFTLVFTMLFVLAMTALIWYRWPAVDLPSSSIVFIGDESVDGAVLAVTRKGQASYSVTLDKQNGYTATVWLPIAGKYDLVITRSNQVLQRESVDIAPMESKVLILSPKRGGPPAPDTSPATQPATVQ